MSCFIMDERALAALAVAAEKLLNHGFDYFGFDAPHSLYDALADCRTEVYRDYSAPLIYAKLYALNARACAGRYREDADITPPDVDFSGVDVTHAPQYADHSYKVCPWHYQLAKLVDCYCYQTDEDATRGDELAKAMRELSNTLRGFIVQHSADYMAASWGTL